MPSHPLQVGMIGSSAGGHLTATVLAYHDEGNPHAADPIEQKRYVKKRRPRPKLYLISSPKPTYTHTHTHTNSCRPDFGMLVYPVITMEGEAANAFSKNNLLGPGLTETQTQNLTEHYSIEKHVGKRFPPTFLFHTKDDADVSVENAFRMDDALTAAGVRT
jgi:acetyl esterase/lipase